MPPGLRLSGMKNEAHTSSQTPLESTDFCNCGQARNVAIQSHIKTHSGN